MIRLAPGEQNLCRLAATDAIAEEVIDGRLAPIDGHAALMALDREPGSHAAPLTVLSFGLAAAGVAGLSAAGLDDRGVRRHRHADRLRYILWRRGASSWPKRWKRWRRSCDAAGGGVAAFIVPLSLKTVIIASLIVLMPGLALTNAVDELASQQLVSGTARFAGAVMTVLKLDVRHGDRAADGATLGLGAGGCARSAAGAAWVEWGALVLAAYAFAVLFQARTARLSDGDAGRARGYADLALGGQGWAEQWLPGGVFFAGVGVAGVGNAYARWRTGPDACACPASSCWCPAASASAAC